MLKRFISVILIAALPALCAGANLMPPEKKASRITMFYTPSDVSGIEGLVKGEIISFSTRVETFRDDFFDSLNTRSSVTVRLYDRQGITEGDTLFAVNGDNLIVSRIYVRAIHHSATFGNLLIGYGNFRFSEEGFRVVMKAENEGAVYADVYRARGDYYRESGDEGSAIAGYKKAISLSPRNPSARLELGYIYYGQEMYRFAFREFSIAYENIRLLYDNMDRYRLLKGMAEIRVREYFYTEIPSKRKSAVHAEAFKYLKEGLEIYPGSAEAVYLTALLYHRPPAKDGDSDAKARDSYLKVLELDPEHAAACVGLAELYHAHKNPEKSRLYAQRALSIDPDSSRAREILNYLDNYNR